METVGKTSRLTQVEVELGYYYLLKRKPSQEEVGSWTSQDLSKAEFRKVLMNSEEFLNLATNEIVRSEARKNTAYERRKPHIKLTDSVSFWAFFETVFAAKLGKRADGFAAMLRALEGLQTSHSVIVESGTMRAYDNFEGDGMSTLIFDTFVSATGGEVWTCDVEPIGASLTRTLCGPQTFSVTCEAVDFLRSFSRASAEQIHLLYLDSLDLDVVTGDNSAQVAYQEYIAALPRLKSGSIIAIDDVDHNDVRDLKGGKGRILVPELEKRDYKCLYRGYQSVWQII